MDDDCETFAKVRNELTHIVEKLGGQNHTAKYICNGLCAPQKTIQHFLIKLLNTYNIVLAMYFHKMLWNVKLPFSRDFFMVDH